MDWSEYPIDRRFTGRQRELERLSSVLLGPNARLVALTGAAGSGKTALAMRFAQLHARSFPAGTYHVHASAFEPLTATIDEQVAHASAPYLLILDDLDTQPSAFQLEDLKRIRRARPPARIVSIARKLEWSHLADLALPLEGLSRSDFEALLETLGFPREAARGAYDRIQGSPLLAQMVADHARSTLRSMAEVADGLSGFQYPGLVGPDGRPLAQGSAQEIQIVSDLRIVSDDLLIQAQANPGLLYEISPRRFEEFVAQLLERLGYIVTLTPASRDGGKDLYAAKKDDLGSFLYVVECKRYAPHQRVGVGLIRQLMGVVASEQVTAGILATTSFFTRDAEQLQQRISHQISLKDYFGLQEWMSKAMGPKCSGSPGA